MDGWMDRCTNRQIAKVHHIAKGGSALKGRWESVLSSTRDVYPAQDQQWEGRLAERGRRRLIGRRRKEEEEEEYT